MFKNLLFIYSGIDDEFHFIYKSDNEKIAVYSSHGRVYYTECWTIHAFEIVENLTVCTIDVLVVFQFQYHEIDGYYTKNGIIREAHNYAKFCKFSASIINIGNLNKDFSIYKYDNQVTIARRNDSFTQLEFEHQN